LPTCGGARVPEPVKNEDEEKDDYENEAIPAFLTAPGAHCFLSAEELSSVPFTDSNRFFVMHKIDRRTFVQRTGWTGFSLLAFGLGTSRAAADPDPPANTKSPAPAPTRSLVPAIYPFHIGSLEAFVILDGILTFPGIQPAFAPEARPSEIEALLKKDFLPTDHLSLAVNVLVVKAKSGVMLFDAGAGRSFGPAAGKLGLGLARIGLAPDDIKTIFVTHVHADHIGGLVSAANHPVFPSARIIAARAEADFWTSDAPNLSGMRTSPEAAAQKAAAAKKVLTGLKANLELKEPGRVAREVELIAAPGHTPGHSLFQIAQGNEKLLVIGDAVHVQALQFPHPEWTIAYDVDAAMAIKTRRKILKDAAMDRTTLMGFHLPFPGIGHVREAGQGYEWVPKPWVV
jgi:glyoxylase-like metal-dependent hydrolase (beta-lactamase superfamily II)